MHNGSHSRSSARLSEVQAGLGEAARVTGDERRPTDVPELEEEEDDTLETDTSTTVGWATVAEPIEVVPHGLRVETSLAHALLEQLRVVNTLAARKDLLAANEEVVRVRELVVGRVAHGVERPGGRRELVQDVVVRVVLFLDECTKTLLRAGAEILVRRGRAAIFILVATLDQELDTVLEVEAESLLKEDEVLRGI